MTSDYSKLLVSVSDRASTEGVVSGRFGTSLTMGLIPSTSDIRPTDIIVTSGLEETIPRGLLVGVIDEIQDTPGEVFKEAIIRPAVSYQRQKIVSIITVNQE